MIGSVLFLTRFKILLKEKLKAEEPVMMGEAKLPPDVQEHQITKVDSGQDQPTVQKEDQRNGASKEDHLN